MHYTVVREGIMMWGHISTLKMSLLLFAQFLLHVFILSLYLIAKLLGLSKKKLIFLKQNPIIADVVVPLKAFLDLLAIIKV